MRKKLSEEDKEEFKKQYFQSKEQLDKIRDDETLAKWMVLSKAYKLGKKIWGHRFTRQRLAFDMELPYTTTLRCLALDRANSNSWKKQEAGKISAFKLAMICQLKCLNYQDDIVDIVIEKNLSTYQIKDLKINSLSDVNKERHRLAVEKGYSRKGVAAIAFQRWIDRGRIFLLLKKEDISGKKYEILMEQLKDLKNKIEEYVE